MLLYNAKNTPSLGYSQPKDQPSAKSYLPEFANKAFDWMQYANLPPADLNAILPAGGKEVLDSQEAVAPQKSPEAQALVEGLLTDDCKVAIRSATANKFAVGMLDLIAIDKKAKTKSLATFTSQLRAWPAAVQSYWLATNERDNEANRQAVVDMQTAAADKMVEDCQYLNDVSKLIEMTKSVKAAETALLKAQILNGGGIFPLSEFHPVEKNAEKIGWFGPVAVRDRVAAIKKVDPKKTGIEYVYTYPIPDMGLWWMTDTENNPEFYAVAPCYADYLPWTAYGTEGASMDKTEWDTYWGESTASWFATSEPGPELPIEAWGIEGLKLDQFMAEQLKRMYDVDLPAYNTVTSEVGDVIPKKVIVSAPVFTIGYLILWGRSLDPEWGGTESENLVINHTPQEVYEALIPELRKRQDERRLALKKGGIFGSESGAGEFYAYLKKVRAVEEGVSTAALLPPVRTKWKVLNWQSVINYFGT